MIYVTGDTHIPIDIHKLAAKRFPAQKELTKDDFLIICGDFGGVWSNSKEEMYWRKWFDQKSFTTLFIDGNHENFDLLHEFPIVDFYGAGAHKISNSIFHLMRGEIYEIEGKRFFTFGGASSHDREHRKEGESWWKEELPSAAEYETAICNLDRIGWVVDYVLTHCGASSVQQMIDGPYEENELTDFFERLKNTLSYEQWFFGHYHVDRRMDERHVAVFDRIIQL